MKFTIILGVGFAMMLHLAFILFGGLLFPEAENAEGSLQEVELLSETTAPVEEKKPEPEPAQEEQAIESDDEPPPDASEMIKSLELADAASAVPELEAASLSAIEAALNGQGGGGGDFAQALDFSSGGRIGGTGKPGAVDSTLDSAFSITEIDQKPRVMFQDAPLYPSDLRGKKVEGVVTVVFIVDAAGKVTNPRVERSTHPSFDKPALEAVRKWKFEAAVRAGQRVA